MMADADGDETPGVHAEIMSATRDYVGRRVERLDAPPSSIEFLRKYVCRNSPFVCANATKDWTAHERWQTKEGFMECCGGPQTKVEAAATRDGRGDAIEYTLGRRVFVEPATMQTTLDDLFSSFELEPKRDEPVLYLSSQNDNLRRVPELRGLLAHCGGESGGLAFADEAFGCAPDAKNVWVGDDRSVTSYHRDYYENLYTVISGTKVFSLRPPCDYPDMRFVKDCAPGRYVFERDPDGRPKWRINVDISAPKVSWSAVDVDPSGKPIHGGEDELLYRAGRPRECALEVEVHSGETLYLPAMWFHRVRQRGLTIAVNSWYDQSFDDRYATRMALDRLADERPTSGPHGLNV